jgi:hypothetical protein
MRCERVCHQFDQINDVLMKITSKSLSSLSKTFYEFTSILTYHNNKNITIVIFVFFFSLFACLSLNLTLLTDVYIARERRVHKKYDPTTFD